MTTGSFANDSTTVHPYYLNGSINGNIRTGVRRSKTWAGIDGLPIARPQGTLRKYTTLDRKTGKVRVYTFRDRLPKRAVSREPHYYSMSASYVYAKKGTGRLLTQYYTQEYADYTFDVDFPVLPTVPAWTSNDDIKLVNKLKEQIRGSDFNLGVFLGEGQQTLKMIGDTAYKLANAYRQVRKGEIGKAIRTLARSDKHAAKIKRVYLDRRSKRYYLDKASGGQVAQTQASGHWLALQYGWLPLLSDMRSGAELIAHRLNVPHKKTYRARHTIVNKDTGSPYWGADICMAAYSKQIIAITTEPESIPKFLGLLDPELIAWELTPFSFVADWIIPFGDYLEARAFARSLSGTFVQTTFIKQSWKGIKGKSFSNDLITGYTVNDDMRYEAETVSLERTVSTALSVPMPTVKSLEKVASWQHCANGVALLAQVFSRK